MHDGQAIQGRTGRALFSSSTDEDILNIPIRWGSLKVRGYVKRYSGRTGRASLRVLSSILQYLQLSDLPTGSLIPCISEKIGVPFF